MEGGDKKRGFPSLNSTWGEHGILDKLRRISSLRGSGRKLAHTDQWSGHRNVNVIVTDW